MNADKSERIRCAEASAYPTRHLLLVDGWGFNQRAYIEMVYCPRVLGQWFDGIRFYAAASSPTRSRRTWAGLR